MGWIVAPDEKRRHRVIIEISGPVDRRKWAKYRAAVKGLVKKFGARITFKRRLRKISRARRKGKG